MQQYFIKIWISNSLHWVVIQLLAVNLWMTENLINDNSTFILVMVLCRQATRYHLSHNGMKPVILWHGFIRPYLNLNGSSGRVENILQFWPRTQIAKFVGPTWAPPGSCRPQMGPMLAPWTLLSGKLVFLRGYKGKKIPHQLNHMEYNIFIAKLSYMFA